MSVQEFVQAFSQAVRVSGTSSLGNVAVSVSQCVASAVCERVVGSMQLVLEGGTRTVQDMWVTPVAIPTPTDKQW